MVPPPEPPRPAVPPQLCRALLAPSVQSACWAAPSCLSRRPTGAVSHAGRMRQPACNIRTTGLAPCPPPRTTSARPLITLVLVAQQFSAITCWLHVMQGHIRVRLPSGVPTRLAGPGVSSARRAERMLGCPQLMVPPPNGRGEPCGSYAPKARAKHPHDRSGAVSPTLRITSARPFITMVLVAQQFSAIKCWLHVLQGHIHMRLPSGVPARLAGLGASSARRAERMLGCPPVDWAAAERAR